MAFLSTSCFKEARNPSQKACTLTHGRDGVCILLHLSWLPAWRPMASWGIASSQISAECPEMGKAQSLLPASSCPEEPAVGGPGGKKASLAAGAASWGGGECRPLAAGLCWRKGILAAPGHQGEEDSPAQLDCIFFGCTEWKILAYRQNRRCEEERGAACLVLELGLEQHAPCRAKLCQLWAVREPCRHHPHPSCAGNSFYCCKSPGHASWKSLKVKSPLRLPIICPGGEGRVQCVAACLSGDNREVASNSPRALNVALFYNKHPSCRWKIVTAKQKA